MNFDIPDGATPISPDATQDLRVPGITTQGQLNELEQENITFARLWVLRLNPTRQRETVLTPDGLRKLHKAMYKDVWKWAGQFRDNTRQLNFGCPAYQIPVKVLELCEDVHAQIKTESVSWDEIGVGYHHRLVSIHPFVNGNGRHSRLAADLLMRAFGRPEFTWGSGADLLAGNQTRKQYIAALKRADAHDLSGLLEFARS